MRILGSSRLLLFVFFFLFHSPILICGQCLNDQRSLLLEVRNGLVFDQKLSTKLVRWNQNVDCCNWLGVDCDSSGHVTGLELDSETITGGIENATSLFSLQYLQKLNLAFNSFTGGRIPTGIGNLTNLLYLNLSNSGIGGQVPVGISTLRNLVSLDLSTQFPGLIPLALVNPNLRMLVQNLSALRELYLDGVNISTQAGDWGQAISSSLPELRNLSMRNCRLSGPLDHSLSKLRSLSVLRLDRNNISAPIPEFFGNFSNLTILSLSSCSLIGKFPDSIFQLPYLENLDLSQNGLLTGIVPQFLQSGSLRRLVLSYTNFSGTLPDSIGNLSMLSMIDMSNCSFSGRIPSAIANLPNLSYLDLSFNSFTGLVPSFNMSKNLMYLDLSHNFLTGPIDSQNLESLSNLVELNLGSNILNGSIPPSIFVLPSLQRLRLSNNQFGGQLNESLLSSSSFSNLDTLDLSNNLLEGSVPDYFFRFQRLNVLLLCSNLFSGSIMLERIQSLQNLTRLELGYNKLSIDARSSNLSLSTFPQLRRLNLASCDLINFPDLRNQTNLVFLDLSKNHLTGVIPNWIWGIGNGQLAHLNLSYNFLVSIQKPFSVPISLSILDLHWNQLSGDLPNPPASTIYLDYSSNRFQGNIPSDIGTFIPFASFFSLANNTLNGSIPASLCKATYLQVLDLSGNSLTGFIPPCLLNSSQSLGVLNLGRNKIHGPIPDMFPVSCGLKTLDLSRNKLEGKVPESLANCSMLEVMNVGYNNINDRFPCMLKHSSSLRVLVLRSNQFHGDVKCPGNQSWPNLQIIDIASNNFGGHLSPRCISTWRGMVTDKNETFQRGHLSFNFLQLNGFYYQDTVTVTIKGLEMVLMKILTVFTSIDLSLNNFDGEIPETIGELNALYVLNLSHNAFTGRIPKEIGNLTELGSLDLSTNQLTGEIPEELSTLTFLSFLNLSHNKLFGRIPTGRQLQTFTNTSYDKNAGLCGYPLTVSCNPNQPARIPTKRSSIASITSGMNLQFIFTGLGYGVGAALFLAPLAFCKEWRDKSDELLEEFLKQIFPNYGFSYIRYDGKTEEVENVEDVTTDDDEDDEDEDTFLDLSGRRYCVFCTKLDINFKKAMHNPKCTCHYSPPKFSSPPTSSSSCSLLVVYH